MTNLQLDTHVVVWLYAGESARLPAQLRVRLNDQGLRFSPMVRLELTYLFELGRITEPADRILDELRATIGLVEDTQPFGTVAAIACGMTFTRDPFDRIITAQAVAAHELLITKDQRILDAHPQHAVWR